MHVNYKRKIAAKQWKQEKKIEKINKIISQKVPKERMKMFGRPTNRSYKVEIKK